MESTYDWGRTFIKIHGQEHYPYNDPTPLVLIVTINIYLGVWYQMI